MKQSSRNLSHFNAARMLGQDGNNGNDSSDNADGN